MVDSARRVTGCAWYLEHPSEVARARFARPQLRRSPVWPNGEASSGRVSKPSSSALARHSCNYAEVGGWAVSEQSRCTSEGLVLALAGYSLGRICGELSRNYHRDSAPLLVVHFAAPRRRAAAGRRRLDSLVLRPALSVRDGDSPVRFAQRPIRNTMSLSSGCVKRWRA